MKKLLLIPILLGALWSAYWVIGKSTLLKALTQAQSDLAQDGITLSAPNVKIKGYPLRYHAVLTDLSLSGAKGTYTPEIINISADALRPTVWTLSAGKSARIRLAGKDGHFWVFDLTADKMRLEFGSSISGKLKSVNAEFQNLEAAPVSGGPPPLTAIDSGFVRLTPSAAPLQDGMQAAFDISGIELAPGGAAVLQKAFGNRVDRLQGTGFAQGLISLAPDDIELWEQSGAVTVPDFTLHWGPVGFIGDVDLDMGSGGSGGANGAATLGISDGDALLAAFVQSGFLTQGQAMAGQFLLMAAPRDDQNQIVLTFPIQDNAVTILGQTLHKF